MGPPFAEVRCPRCNAALTPDEIRRADPAIDCPFCKTRVLVKPTPPSAPALVPISVARPSEFLVVEEAVPSAQVDEGGPFRSMSVSVRPTLTITWRDRFRRRSLGLFGATLGAMSLAYAATGFAAASAITGILAAVLLWGVLSDAMTVRLTASRETLLVTCRRISGARARASNLRLPAAEIAQLFVVERAKPSDGTKGEYLLVARDRAGDEHPIVAVRTPKEAWWLEERLERHLGITDEEISAREHRRPLELPPAVSPRR